MDEVLMGIIIGAVIAFACAIGTRETVLIDPQLTTKMIEADAYCVGHGGTKYKRVSSSLADERFTLEWMCISNGVMGEINWEGQR